MKDKATRTLQIRPHNPFFKLHTRRLNVFAVYLENYIYPVICCMLMLACTDSEPAPQSHYTVPTDTTIEAPRHFYKRLTGSVAGSPVTVHLTSFNGYYTGYCYYNGTEAFVTLSAFSDTVNPGYVRLDELNITSRVPDSSFQPYWLLELNSYPIKGMRIAGATLPTGEIRLEEAYPDGSVRMELIYHSLRAAYQDESDTPFVTSTHRIMWPMQVLDSSCNTFLARRFAALAGCSDPSAVSKYRVLDCVSELDKHYFNDYRKIITESGMQSDELRRPINNHTRDVLWNITGNENGVLTIEITSGEYTGGAHGNYTTLYHCLDIQGQRDWTLADIIEIDSVKLKVLLDMAARHYFQTADSASLQERLLVSEIPITENFFLTPAGITFCYQPYEIASYADGVIPLFISYRDLKDMLLERFKKRMQLESPHQTHVI